MELFKLYYRRQDDDFIMPYEEYEPGWFHYFGLVKKNKEYFDIYIKCMPEKLFKSVSKEFELIDDHNAYRFIVKNII
jgi:hypothetical protein